MAVAASSGHRADGRSPRRRSSHRSGGRGARIGSFQAEPGDLEDLGARAADGRLRVEIGGRYAFEDAAQAVLDFAQKHIRGKVLITVT
ncbi:zinc-binding dehydrogenase [Streptomyces sp. CA-135486]|uniref:zinc-binding dehydrogenase n=1 Tax=Streptomyces sp. CA-135486 TaxID=3240049 RepID=UPI003D94B2AA